MLLFTLKQEIKSAENKREKYFKFKIVISLFQNTSAETKNLAFL